MSEWKKYKLDDVAQVQTGPFGSQLHQRDYKLKGTPIITVEHLGENKIIHNNLPLVSDEDKERLSKYILKEGDIVFSRVGSVDRRAYVNSKEGGWLFSGRCLRVRANKKIVDPRYLSYYFGLESFKEHIRMIAVGATMPSINTEILSGVALILPDLEEQKSIASILSSLDDKIDLLHRQNQTLEALAETLFRQWFVEKAEESWGAGKLGDYGEFKNGINYSRDEAGNTTYGIINVRDVMGNKFIFKEAVNEINIDFRKAEPYLLQKFDIVIVRSASPGETALILENQKKLIYSGFTIRFRPHKEREAFFFFQLMQSIKKHLDIFSDGTTLKNLNQEILKNIEFQVPSFESIETFNEKAEPIFDKISKNLTQIRTLTRLRDTLLPKLMSGEVRAKI